LIENTARKCLVSNSLTISSLNESNVNTLLLHGLDYMISYEIMLRFDAYCVMISYGLRHKTRHLSA